MSGEVIMIRVWKLERQKYMTFFFLFPLLAYLQYIKIYILYNICNKLLKKLIISPNYFVSNFLMNPY